MGSMECFFLRKARVDDGNDQKEEELPAVLQACSWIDREGRCDESE